MKSLKSSFFFLCMIYSATSIAQKTENIKASQENWTVFNRTVKYDNAVIHLDGQTNDGLLWINGMDFKNGIIEIDIKGKDVQGESFTGIAFHGLDNKTFEGIYFRPFNFKNPERSSHAIQYIFMPDHDWSELRNKYPGKYEHTINPVPDPNNWFHAKIVVSYPEIKVYVNNSDKPTLEVEAIGTNTNGKIGIWVGNGSEGWFKNFTITKMN